MKTIDLGYKNPYGVFVKKCKACGMDMYGMIPGDPDFCIECSDEYELDLYGE